MYPGSDLVMRLLGAGVFLASTSCAGSYLFVARTPALPSSPKPSDCQLYVVNDWRYRGYAELGFVEWDGGVGVPRTTEDVYRQAQTTVCEAGGDVVITQPNNAGKYIRGIVLKQMGP